MHQLTLYVNCIGCREIDICSATSGATLAEGTKCRFLVPADIKKHLFPFFSTERGTCILIFRCYCMLFLKGYFISFLPVQYCLLVPLPKNKKKMLTYWFSMCILNVSCILMEHCLVGLRS